MTPPAFARMSGITVTPRSRRIASASGVVGPFAPSATIVALMRSALSSRIWEPMAAGRAADDERLAGDDPRDGLALGHRVGIHHPRHRLLVGAKVRGRDVVVGSDHEHDLDGVPTREVLALGH